MNDDQLISLLKGRFYYLNEQGTQRFYWDSVTGERLQTMHLFPHCYRWMENAGGDTAEFGGKWLQFMKRLRGEYFTPIVLNPKYRPEQPAVVNVEGNWHPNSWRPPEVKVPEQQLDYSPFVEHLTLMLGSKKKADYLLDHLAYRYQNPDHVANPKPHIAFFLYGKPGFGKGTFLKVIQNVFGESAVKTAADQSELKGGSSVDLWKRTWLFVEEVDVRPGSTDWNKIKGFTGTSMVDAAMKYQHVSKHELPAQLIMFSNSAPTFIEPNDRRFFISKFETEFKDSEEKRDYFTKYHKWLDSGDAYPAIAYLLKHRNIKRFKLADEAMMTDEKREITTLVSDVVVDHIRAELEDKDNKAICFVPSDFRELWEKHGIKPSQIKHKLSEAGLKMNRSSRYRCETTGKSLTLELWTRPEWTLNRKQGTPATLVKDDGRRMPLVEDEGYQRFWEQKHLERRIGF